MKKGHIVIEGHGELGAADNLVNRLWVEAGHSQPWAPARRWKNLHARNGVQKAIQATVARGDAGALLILRDEDDACPRERGPEMAEWARALEPPFPVATVLLHREYEVLFLPCLQLMSGRPIRGADGQERVGLLPGTRFEGSWESKRGVKEWLTAHFPPGRAYKPTLDQLPLTRMIDLAMLRAADVPCFGTLERALTFLGSCFGRPGVYPPRREGRVPA